MSNGVRTLLLAGALLLVAYLTGLAVLAAVGLVSGSRVAWVLLLLGTLGLMVVAFAVMAALAVAISVRRARRDRHDRHDRRAA